MSLIVFGWIMIRKESVHHGLDVIPDVYILFTSRYVDYWRKVWLKTLFGYRFMNGSPWIISIPFNESLECLLLYIPYLLLEGLPGRLICHPQQDLFILWHRLADSLVFSSTTLYNTSCCFLKRLNSSCWRNFVRRVSFEVNHASLSCSISEDSWSHVPLGIHMLDCRVFTIGLARTSPVATSPFSWLTLVLACGVFVFGGTIDTLLFLGGKRFPLVFILATRNQCTGLRQGWKGRNLTNRSWSCLSCRHLSKESQLKGTLL